MISFENKHNPEIPTREEIIFMFKSHGESVEAIGAYFLWFKEKQKEADESKGEYSRLIFNIDVADLLIDCGLIDNACEYLDGAWDIMDNEIARASETNLSGDLAKLHEKLVTVTEKVR